jgi:hypothetical protein
MLSVEKYKRVHEKEDDYRTSGRLYIMFMLYIHLNNLVSVLCIFFSHDKWVAVTTVWCDLRLQIEEQLTRWKVAANILNKRSQTADKGLSSRMGVGQGANNSSL